MNEPPTTLAHRFAYHKPGSDEVVKGHERIRLECKLMAEVFRKLLPEGREARLAITKLEEAMMWANASIARSQTVCGGVLESDEQES